MLTRWERKKKAIKKQAKKEKKQYYRLARMRIAEKKRQAAGER